VRNLVPIFILALLLSNQARALCLAYDPAFQELSGKLVKQSFPGLPNYESIKNGDAAETGFYLLLAKPICTTGDPKDGTAYPQKNIMSIQLVLDQKGYSLLRKYLGKSVTIRGTLFAAHTGHHHAKVLMERTSLVNRNGL